MSMIATIKTAATDDYEDINESITFVADNSLLREECIEIGIADDELLEDVEDFTVLINSSDLAVMITRGSSDVILIDSSG